MTTIYTRRVPVGVRADHATTDPVVAREWRSRGHAVTPDPDAPAVRIDAPIPDTPDQAYRIKHFGVESEPLRHPLFKGERLVRLIHNERQSSSIALAPHEAQQMVDHLIEEFSLAAGGTELATLRAQHASAVARVDRLSGLILSVLDSWWPFVHGAVGASTRARNLRQQLSDAIQPEAPPAHPNPTGAKQ